MYHSFGVDVSDCIRYGPWHMLSTLNWYMYKPMSLKVTQSEATKPHLICWSSCTSWTWATSCFHCSMTSPRPPTTMGPDPSTSWPPSQACHPSSPLFQVVTSTWNSRACTHHDDCFSGQYPWSRVYLRAPFDLSPVIQSSTSVESPAVEPSLLYSIQAKPFAIRNRT